MTGALVVRNASELVKNVISRAKSMLQEFYNRTETHEYESANSLRVVLSQHSISHSAAFEHANYMKVLTLFDNKF